MSFENRACEPRAGRDEYLGRRDEQGSMEHEPGDVLVIDSAGRRSADRREPAPLSRLPLGQPEPRLCPRRLGERRGFNRLEPVDWVAGDWTQSD